MVGTRPKNKLNRIPHRTKIDLTKPLPSTKTKARKRLAMADPSETNPTEEQPQTDPTEEQANLLVSQGDVGEEEPAPEGDNEEEEHATSEHQEEETSEKVVDRLRKIKKEKATPPSKKSKASSSAAGSTPGVTGEEEKEESKEVSLGKQSKDEQEKEKKETKEEEAADEEVAEEKTVEEDEPPAKCAKTPSHSRGKIVSVTASENFSTKEIVVPKKLDFKVLKQLGINEEVRQKFTAIG